MKSIYFFIVLIFIAQPVNTLATPTGQDLVDACEKSLGNRATGLDINMCEWYVTPCDCNTGAKAELPRVCLPEDHSSRDLARLVIDKLRVQPELLSQAADRAVSTVLSKLYPCEQFIQLTH